MLRPYAQCAPSHMLEYRVRLKPEQDSAFQAVAVQSQVIIQLFLQLCSQHLSG